MKSIAVVAAKGLGDGLIYSVLAHNFALANQKVTLFSTPLVQLSSWFPRLHILPYPEKFDFVSFEAIYAQDHTPLSHLEDPKLTLFKESALNKTETIVQNLATFYAKWFPNHPTTKTTGLVIPSKWEKHKYPKRIVFHPTATNPKRVWSHKKFQKLAYKLAKEGWDPVFCLTPEEKELYKNTLTPIHACHTFDELAGFLSESGGFIGNNSGPGHLASAIGLSTITLFARKSYSHLWRPAWGNNIVITPLPFLMGARAKHRYWQNCLTVSQVASAFHKLTTRSSGYTISRK